MHGTSLGLSNFLVSTDCNSNKKKDTCIGYDWLKGWIDKVMDKGAQHLFVALDACQAGLGLWSKSGATTALGTLPTARAPTGRVISPDTTGKIRPAVKYELQARFVTRGSS